MAKPKLKNIHKFIEPYIVTSGEHFRLKDYRPEDTHHLNSEDKPEAKKWLQRGVELLSDLQQVLYAQGNWGLLLVFQAMDAAGKDGTIKHVMSGVNPQGVDVHSFKSPSAEELAHDFLWRTNRCMPPRGKIGIFNRSYYEEVLVVRVHPEFLQKQRLPDSVQGNHFWKGRYEDIGAFERYLTRNGIAVCKFFLHLSKKEQKRRFLERLNNKDKNWKFSAADLKERKYWDEYQDAYEKMIRNTAAKHAPWVIVPADNKWFSRLLVVATIVATLDKLNLQYPKITPGEITELKEARKHLEKE
ncbi:MAG TPA: polyphosphate kinase 2 family protein [Verrucomicrobiae bacterium]|jgi:PPK2 family polyphosphate:nucleotide phosphotransferase|nr:polyphosphate kinase 2 family protein [Verrucomicrobiae bacterium]